MPPLATAPASESKLAQVKRLVLRRSVAEGIGAALLLVGAIYAAGKYGDRRYRQGFEDGAADAEGSEE